MSKFIFLMNTKIRSFAFCLTACLLACVTGHAYEQDNWYLAMGEKFRLMNRLEFAYYEENDSYWSWQNLSVGNGTYTAGRVSVYDLNGSLGHSFAVRQH